MFRRNEILCREDDYRREEKAYLVPHPHRREPLAELHEIVFVQVSIWIY